MANRLFRWRRNHGSTRTNLYSQDNQDSVGSNLAPRAESSDRGFVSSERIQANQADTKAATDTTTNSMASDEKEENRNGQSDAALSCRDKAYPHGYKRSSTASKTTATAALDFDDDDDPLEEELAMIERSILEPVRVRPTRRATLKF